MGLFDRFKKPDSANLLGALKARYALQKKAPPPESSLMQDWWVGELEGKTLAFQERRQTLAVYLGEIVEVTSIYLTKSAPGKEFRPGAELDASDARKLGMPALRDGLAQLSPSVQEVHIYENDRGLSLLVGADATLETIAADLAIAQGMLRALEQAAG